MTCAELEILLCDYTDGTLRAEEKAALEKHLAECPACAELAADIASVTAFIERVETVEPPPELVTRILHQIPDGRLKLTDPRSWWANLFGGWVQNILQPRYVMGMAMTILSFSMLARFAHIPDRPLRPSDLDPVKAWQSIDDRSHRIWDHAMKYYDNLRLVIEIQSRLKEWTDQEPTADNAQQKTEGSSRKPVSGTSEDKR